MLSVGFCFGVVLVLFSEMTSVFGLLCSTQVIVGTS